MKLLMLVPSILIIFFFTDNLSYAQSSAEEFYNRGVEYGAQGEYKKAKAEFEKALGTDSFYDPAKICLKIIADFNKQKINREIIILLFKGIAYYIEEKFGQAIYEFTRCIELKQNYADTYYYRGYIYYKQLQYEQSIADFTIAIDLNPNFIEVYNSRGSAYGYLNQYDKSIADYNKAIKLNPDYAEAYNNKGIAFYSIGQNEKAIIEFDRAIRINPRYADAYYNRGIYYDDNSKYDQAIADYTKTLEINPNYVEAYTNRGIIFFVKLGNKEKGCADFKKACELGRCKNYNLAKQNGDCQ